MKENYLNTKPTNRNAAVKYYMETYGCQMNIADSRIVDSILNNHQIKATKNINEADIILLNTCAIRQNAEDRVLNRIEKISVQEATKSGAVIGVLGCIPEYSKEKLLQHKNIDFIAGPDTYRELPGILNELKTENKLQLIGTSLETYENCIPSYQENSISDFVSIMRGCNNFCSYCVVPYTRGRERSKSPEHILKEVDHFAKKGIKEITLLGQNVNSYFFKNQNSVIDFPALLKIVALSFPNLRIRFATSHPKDLKRPLVETIAKYPNICEHIHLALQSGSNSILELMNRKYSREEFLARIKMAREIIPDIGLTTDIIAGFCSEQEADHEQTLKLMKEIRFDWAFMFAYSERSGTFASNKLKDDVPLKVKKRRLQEIIDLQHDISLSSNEGDVGKEFEVLVEGESKKSNEMLRGRNKQNKMIVFPGKFNLITKYTRVKVLDCTSATLIGEIV